MQTTGRYFTAAWVVAALSSAVFAQAQEPTAKDMYEAYADYWDLVGERQKRLWAQCQAGQVDRVACGGMVGAGGPMEVRVVSLDKYGCTPAPDRQGHNCSFSATVRVQGGNEFMAQMLANSAGSQKTLLFSREGGNWTVAPRSDQ